MPKDKSRDLAASAGREVSGTARILQFPKPTATLTLSEIEDAFLFVCAMERGINTAVIDLTTSKIFYCSDLGDFDEWPDHLDDAQMLEVPHKNELDLGRRLVEDFVDTKAPELENEVYRIFRHRGAYSRFRALLTSNNLLAEWYAYEQERTLQALTEWCEENGLALKPAAAGNPSTSTD